jgi:uncharacterized protein (TIGR02266 family)
VNQIDAGFVFAYARLNAQNISLKCCSFCEGNVTDEQRNLPRLPMFLDVAWDGTGQLTARTSDLSLGGCFIDTVSRVSEGEVVRFRLRMPEGDWLQLAGVVMYVHSNIGFGLRFVDLSAEAKSKLQKIIENRNRTK